ncbi:MAG: ABC transporter permease [Actinomycetota bacterium]
MGRYVGRRLLWAVVLLFVVSLVVFAVFYLLPSTDPALLRAGKQPTPELVARIRKVYRLDRSWVIQFYYYMKGLILHFDFGTTFIGTPQPVRNEIFSRFPTTVYLAFGAAVLWIVSGVSVGILSAVKRGSLADRAAMGFSLIAISAPVYWFGLVMLFFFSKDGHFLPIFPGAGSCIEFNPIRCFPDFILPWFVLSFAFMAVYARMSRSSVLDTLREDYIRTARAKGLSERRVVFKHALRGALTPVVSLFGLDLAGLLGGAILTETVFNIPGLGRYAFNAITSGDLPVIQGTVLFGAFFIILANLLVDMLYAVLDPRVRYS